MAYTDDTGPLIAASKDIEAAEEEIKRRLPVGEMASERNLIDMLVRQVHSCELAPIARCHLCLFLAHPPPALIPTFPSTLQGVPEPIVMRALKFMVQRDQLEYHSMRKTLLRKR